jgi:hypothetical protein
MSRRNLLQMLVVAAVTACMLALSGVLRAQGRSEEALAHVKEVQERHTAKLLAKEGVVGTAVGLSHQNKDAVLVLLERPGIGGIPQKLEGVPVDTVVIGRVYALALTTSRLPRPVPIGVSAGHPAITAGTIGCRVKGGGKIYDLSNNHVFANENRARIGDNILQPGRYDGGVNPRDAIGTLAAFEPIKFDGSINTIDAALAIGTTSTMARVTPTGGYGMPKITPAAAYVGMPVQKFGRTTGLTTGRVYALNATVRVGYSSGTAVFAKQIVITPGTFSAGGDSGSLIVTKSVTNSTNARPVGLLFAGSSAYTIANPISLVLSRFGVAVDGQ